MASKWQAAVASALILSALVVPAAEAASYTVQKGDTLTKIAKEHEVTVEQLKQWNNLKADAIFINQKLVVTDGAVKANKVAVVEKMATHTVKKGDTLASIAQKNNMTVAQLKELNKLQSDVIYINQKLQINKVSPSKPQEVTVEAPVITTSPKADGQAVYNQVIALAHELIGTPYVFAGNTIEGFDCSGFVKYVYSNAGLNISRKSSLDYYLQDTTAVEQPMPGDVVFFKNTYIPNISHMGIYIGEDQFIHAGTTGVEISKVTHSYWAERLVGYKRFNGIE
ncbi:C40 family peptidase [Metasolibacillus sp.]|uniref:C40 family peptidase n=1 Tax=Metasolibacillus sp. TaxID=2703680 RepID=UPI0025FA9A3D|nr:C40 family peptidase [Metasolibacillus sp.]MCT6923351.1 LysM peptidoglycan-binding domain-containing protein [Metasolibacillus sp.]MCT6941019.1 LysM peptidoglycan-binding domain-containing protein [Metasolibacillus sp.]